MIIKLIEIKKKDGTASGWLQTKNRTPRNFDRSIAKQYVYFKDLPVSAEFTLNGDTCKKRSSRTMDLTYNGFTKWFYASKSDLCVVGQYSMI